MNRNSAAAGATAKVGRNDPCPCGSGRKFKHCCQDKDQRSAARAAAPGRGRSAAPAERLQALRQAALEHSAAERWAEAAPLLQEIVRLDPHDPTSHRDLGIVYARSGLLHDAAASLEQAVKLRPGWSEAIAELARVLEEAGRSVQAALAYRRLSRGADSPRKRLEYAARASICEGDLKEAEGRLRGLLVVAPRNGGARVLLAQVLSRLGRFDEAAQNLAEAVDEAPAAFETLAAIRRMQEEDRPLIERVRLIAGRPELDLATRVGVRLALGKAFDDLGETAEAMRQYEAGNRLRAASLSVDRAGLAARCGMIVERFTAEELSRLGRSLARPAAPGDELPVFVIGMPRSGTTLVEQILSSHSAIVAGDELIFWRNRFTSWLAPGKDIVPDAAALAAAAADYRALLREIGGPAAIRVTDKQPWNFMLVWLLRLAFPEARIIHCRRHPVDTCLSILFANLWSFQYGWDRGDLVFYYRQYERLMDHWRHVLPPDRFTEIDYERLVEDREAETRRLIAFCGLDWEVACLAPERNMRAVRTTSLWQARQPVYRSSLARWRRYEPWLGELRELLPAGGSGEERGASASQS
jgi:Flp pilus assembly protein TadD